MKKIALLIAAACLSMAAMAQNPDEIIANLKSSIAPDGRTAIWDVKTIEQDGWLTVYGTVGTQQQADAVYQELTRHGLDCRQGLIVLEKSIPADQRWALVKLSIATLRCEPRHAAEIATQAIMGMPVKVVQRANDEWMRVQTPDGYIAYVPESSLAYKTEAGMQDWRADTRYVVTVYDSRLVTEPKGDVTVTDLVLGNVLQFKARKGKWLLLATPDGRQGYVEQSQVQELAQWAQQEFNPALIEATARRMMGSSYLWGGTSTKVTDCSGLTKVSYLANAIILQRDASQQCLTGTVMSGDNWRQYEPMDLLFFGNSATGRVTHVGLYLGNGKFIHCSGQVKINSLDPQDSTYLYSPLRASRIRGMVGTPGVTAVKDHPWYF